MSKRTSTETWCLPEDLIGPWRDAAHLGRELQLPEGKSIYRQGELSSSFYLILRGKVDVWTVREDGTTFTIEIMGAGAVCGEAAAFDGLPCFSSATVIEPSVLMRFDVHSLREAFREQPDLAMSLMRVFAAKQRIMSVRAQHLSAPSPEVRIGELLGRLGNTYGTTGPLGVSLPFNVTHEQIATMTGTSRVTVTRSLKRLREIGALSVSNGKLRILDPGLLHQ